MLTYGVKIDQMKSFLGTPQVWSTHPDPDKVRAMGWRYVTHLELVLGERFRYGAWPENESARLRVLSQLNAFLEQYLPGKIEAFGTEIVDPNRRYYLDFSQGRYLLQRLLDGEVVHIEDHQGRTFLVESKESEGDMQAIEQAWEHFEMEHSIIGSDGLDELAVLNRLISEHYRLSGGGREISFADLCLRDNWKL